MPFSTNTSVICIKLGIIIICFSKIQLVGPKNIETKHLSLVKARLFCCQNITNVAEAFRYEWAITYSLVVAPPIRMQH